MISKRAAKTDCKMGLQKLNVITDFKKWLHNLIVKINCKKQLQEAVANIHSVCKKWL